MATKRKAVGKTRKAEPADTRVLHAALDALPVGFALFDADGKLSAWNARLAGLKLFPKRLLKKGAALGAFRAYDKALSARVSRPREIELRKGVVLRASSSRVPPRHLLVTYEDVSAQKRVEGERDQAHAEAREASGRQTATAEILQVMASAPTDVRPVFDAIARNAARLLAPASIGLSIVEGDVLQLGAVAGPLFADGRSWSETANSFYPVPFDPSVSVAARSIVDGSVLEIPDIEAKGTPPRVREMYRAGGARSNTQIPLILGGKGIGAIGVAHPQPGFRLSDKQLELMKAFAAQATIAIENVRLFNETREALERQTATAEILKVISESPTDVQPVFDAIVRSAARLFGCGAAIQMRDGVQLQLNALASQDVDLARIEKTRGLYPLPFDPEASRVSRALKEGRILEVPDVEAPDAPRSVAAVGQAVGFRSAVNAPLMRADAVLGMLSLFWSESGRRLDDHQLGLLQTFTDQAVIAIENVRLFNETREALERQTATAQILEVISRSQTDLQPVFDTIADSAMRLCDGDQGVVGVYDGELIHLASIKGKGPEEEANTRKAWPRPPGRGSVTARAVLTRAIAHVSDVLQDPDYELSTTAQAGGWRSVVSVPMLRGGSPIGVISVTRRDPIPFSAEQIALLKTFADQAVIAIENVRLFNETKEALERQTATAEILKVIASSPTDVQPVFQAIVENAARLMAPCNCGINMLEGDSIYFRAAAGAKTTPEQLERMRALFPIPFDPNQNLVSRAIAEGRVIHVDPTARDAPPQAKAVSAAIGAQSMTQVPLMKAGKGIGAITVRSEDPAFRLSERQLALMRTFADQAVIAIENVRLFNETKEALERQTATAEVLQVISSSVADTTPVFDKIIRSCEKLFGVRWANVALVRDDGLIDLVHDYGRDDLEDWEIEVRKFVHTQFPRPVHESIHGYAILKGEVLHYPDVDNGPDVPQGLRAFNEVARARFAALGRERNMSYNYSVMYAPMFWEGKGIGAIGVHRVPPAPFADKDIRLLKTFADQASIAIQNARLFNETKEALERQTATAEILKVISESPTNVQPVFDAITRSAAQLFPTCITGILMREGDQVALNGLAGPTDIDKGAMARTFPVPFDPEKSLVARAIVSCDVMQIVDSEAPETPESAKQAGRAIGFRSLTTAPLVREGVGIGAISVGSPEAGIRLSDKQISLLRTFADQAVIAIENVRLFNETKEALERQTATAEILKVISESPTDVQPVFDAIAESARKLFGDSEVGITLIRGDAIELVAAAGMSKQRLDALHASFPRPLNLVSTVNETVVDGRLIHYPDMLAEDVPSYTRDTVRSVGIRAMLGVPLLRERRSIGGVFLSRATPGAYTDQQIALLKTFADQAVIAIENVRLFNETKEALERQTATAEILKVISRSPTDAQPVFDAIVGAAVRLIGCDMAFVQRRDGATFSIVAGATPQGLLSNLAPDQPVDAAANFPARAMLSGQMLHLPDWSTIELPPHERNVRERFGIASALYVPLLREGECIGVLTLAARRPHHFGTPQIILAESFRDQAVIAIENTRLFNETKEALERQTATAEILKVISESPTDVQPVFDAIVRASVSLCDGRLSTVLRYDGEFLDIVAHHNLGAEGLAMYHRVYPARVSRDVVAGCAILDRAVINLPDSQADGVPAKSRALAIAAGFRSVLVVPILREGEPIGIVNVARAEAGPFSQTHVDLLQTFADQAVIAIENVRLFNETKEALERQTATAEILKVISESPTDVQPVFDAITETAVRLCDAVYGAVLTVEDDMVHLRSRYGWNERDRAYGDTLFPMPLSSNHLTPIAIRERRIIRMDHLQDDPSVPESSRNLARTVGYQSLVIVPMRGEGRMQGAVVVTSSRSFTDHQADLLQIFTDQAEIAIENVRLFKELQQRTEALTRSVGQLTALGEVSQTISSTLDLEKVLPTIVSRAVQLTGLDGGAIYEYDEARETFALRAGENVRQEILELDRSEPIRIGEGAIGRAAATREPVQVPDIATAGARQTRGRDVLLQIGARALLAVPLLREGHILGALAVIRNTPGEFAPEVIALLDTFATQSAIAIQNARLFREIEDKSRQLELASQHKSQFLASMSHELRTPLNAILGFNELILGGIYGEIADDMRPPLEQMQGSGRHLLGLINNVLDLAKIEANKMELALADYSVHDVVSMVRSTLQSLATDKGLELVTAVPDDLPLAHGDGGRLSQCLINLAGNAIKFTKQGSVKISVALEDETLRFSVVDTGIGIPADKIGNLFTEFKQTDATVASEYGGTGLGLSISKKFIEMHGGRIWVESAPGEGSTFIFEVPLRVIAGAAA